MQKEFQSQGLDVNIESKTKDDAEIRSAFLKGNTLMLMISFFPKEEDVKRIVPSQKIKIKIEIDIDNPNGGNTELRYRMLPSPYEVRVFDGPSLFAGKIHAILCRDYKYHVKGRDCYDYLFYIGKGSGFNLSYLEGKLKNTGGKIANDEALTLERVRELLQAKFESVDYESAKEDVSNFITNKESLGLWKKELFLATLSELKAN